MQELWRLALTENAWLKGGQLIIPGFSVWGAIASFDRGYESIGFVLICYLVFWVLGQILATVVNMRSDFRKLRGLE